MVAVTKERKPRNKGGSKADESDAAFIDVGVEFGGVSIGQGTARLSCKIDRKELRLTKADECFCGHRLIGKVVLGRREDAGGQQQFVEDLNHQVSGSFDCKRLGLSADFYSIGLTFSLKDIDIAELAKFSKGTGRLVVKDVSEIPEDEKAATAADPEKEEDDEEEEDSDE